MEHTPILTPITGMDPGGGDGPTATGVLTMSGVIGTEPDARPGLRVPGNWTKANCTSSGRSSKLVFPKKSELILKVIRLKGFCIQERPEMHTRDERTNYLMRTVLVFADIG